MLKVGLTGGYASGKSFVAKCLERLGCHLIYADRLGHQALLPSGQAYQPTVSVFGTGILNQDGNIDRKKLGAIVFLKPDLLRQLNEIVHPAVFHLEEQLLVEFELQDGRGIAVIEAAILIETGRYRKFDKLIVTTCSAETQTARGMERDHVTREEAMARIALQIPDVERLRAADYVIRTDGSLAESVAQTEAIHGELRQLAEAFSR